MTVSVRAPPDSYHRFDRRAEEPKQAEAIGSEFEQDRPRYPGPFANTTQQRPFIGHRTGPLGDITDKLSTAGASNHCEKAAKFRDQL